MAVWHLRNCFLDISPFCCGCVQHLRPASNHSLFHINFPSYQQNPSLLQAETESTVEVKRESKKVLCMILEMPSLRFLCCVVHAGETSDVIWHLLCSTRRHIFTCTHRPVIINSPLNMHDCHFLLYFPTFLSQTSLCVCTSSHTHTNGWVCNLLRLPQRALLFLQMQ